MSRCPETGNETPLFVVLAHALLKWLNGATNLAHTCDTRGVSLWCRHFFHGVFAQEEVHVVPGIEGAYEMWIYKRRFVPVNDKKSRNRASTIQYNTIQSNLFQLSHMSIIIIIHCIFLNEKSKRICRKLNKLIRDIPRITHNQFT